MSNNGNGKCFILSWLMPLLFWHVEVAMFSPSIFTIHPPKNPQGHIPNQQCLKDRESLQATLQKTTNQWDFQLPSPTPQPESGQFRGDLIRDSDFCMQKNMRSHLLWICVYSNYIVCIFLLWLGHLEVKSATLRPLSWQSSTGMPIIRARGYAYLGLSKHYAPRNR